MTKKKEEIHFGQAFDELEKIAAWFEKGEPDLEEGLKKFERGMEISKVLRERLKQAENVIKDIRAKHEGDS